MHVRARQIVSAAARDEGGFTLALVMIAGVLRRCWSRSSLDRGAGRPQPDPQRPRPQAGLRGRAGRDRRLRVPPQQRHQLLDPCTSVPTPERGQPAGLDHQAPRRCPAATGATYAIELLRASTGEQRQLQHLEPGRDHARDERPRAPGPSASARPATPATPKQSIVATFKRAQLPRLHLLHPARDLGPGHLRQRRRRSPAPTPSARRRSQRGPLQRRDPRLGRRSSATGSCSSTATTSTGPLHTNDALLVCGTPTFGRTRPT